jgi:hypothetical protein
MFFSAGIGIVRYKMFHSLSRAFADLPFCPVRLIALSARPCYSAQDVVEWRPTWGRGEVIDHQHGTRRTGATVIVIVKQSGGWQWNCRPSPDVYGTSSRTATFF